MEARKYQLKCIEDTMRGFESYQRQVVVLPTGSGKTCIFSWTAARFAPQKTLVLAHREELIDQALRKFHETTGVFAQKEKAEFKASRSAPVVIASIQSMIKRLAKWPSNHFGLVVCDEAHHSVSNSWQQVLTHFSPAKILGVTATPHRTDKKQLAHFYENIPFQISMLELMHLGFLVPKITVKNEPLKIDVSNVKTGYDADSACNDFSKSGLADALAPHLKAVAESIKHHAMFRRTLVFVPLIATSVKFVEICREIGINARHVDGESEDRKEILRDFAAGEFDLLSNAMLLTEGYDDPGIDCIVILRLTKSGSLYRQMIGRGTRIHPGKRDLLLLDYLWQTGKHFHVGPYSLFCDTEEAAQEAKLIAESKYGQEDLDLENLATEAQVSREEKLLAELEKKSRKQGRTIDAAEFCMSSNRFADADYEPVMAHELRPVSDSQKDVLQKYAIDIESVKGKEHADKVLDLIGARMKAGLASPKQLRCLIQMRYPGNPHLATMQQANDFLERRFSSNRK